MFTHELLWCGDHRVSVRGFTIDIGVTLRGQMLPTWAWAVEVDGVPLGKVDDKVARDASWDACIWLESQIDAGSVVVGAL